MSVPVKKPIRDCSLHELRTFCMKVENITTLNGQLVEKMSVKQIVKDLTELGYADAYVSTEPDKSAPLDVQSHLLYEAVHNIALEEESERWFKIRIDSAPNSNGKSKNVPVSVAFNDNIGYIPRSVPVWVVMFSTFMQKVRSSWSEQSRIGFLTGTLIDQVPWWTRSPRWASGVRTSAQASFEIQS